MVKINCQAADSKKTFVVDGLVERSTIAALKAYIEEHSVEGKITLTKGGKELSIPDHLSLQKAGLKDGDTILFSVKAEPKVKKEEKKKQVEINEVKETKEKKESEEETQAELYGVDLGLDFRQEVDDFEDWCDVDFGIPEEEKERERERDTSEADEPESPVTKGPASEPFSPDAVTDEDALPQMAPPMMLRQKSYVVLGKIEITQRQKEVLDKVVDTLELPTSRAVMLLRAFDWEADNAIAAYKKDALAALKKAGVSEEELKKEKEEETKEKTESKDYPPKEEGTFLCQSCFTDCEFKDSFALEGCGHRYCFDCWQGWCIASFDKGQECVFTECIFGTEKTKCHEILPPEFVKKQLDSKKQEKFQDWLNVAFVKQNIHVKWCPRPGCDKAVEYKKKGMKKVTCACGYSFCFGCGQEDHEPAPCDGVREWLKKANQESDIFKWLEDQKENKDVKNCTKCHIVIEKNQGCMHMTCKNCRHEFCWLCFQDWHGHDSGLCTQYQKDADGKLAKERQGEESGNEFRRYQFYFTRWDNYRKSIAFAERIKETAEKRMEALQAMKGASLSSVKFLLDAVEMVIACRKLLQWSYVWSYILKGHGIVQDLFKHHLWALEEFTEELGALTEQPLDKLMLDAERTDVINKTRVIGKYKQNIIDFALENHSKLDTISPGPSADTA